MNLLCIDPGPVVSGAVMYDGEELTAVEPAVNNYQLLEEIKSFLPVHKMVIEMVDSYGMPVGKDVFETCVWIGRFMQAFPGQTTRITRKEVKMLLCNSMRAKDSNIRQAILDRFPATGGGKTPQIGTKKHPGPLYGLKKHAVSALAVGVTYYENKRVGRK